MITLRPYQQQTVDSIRQAYIDQCKAPLAVLPTGGGKTVVFSHIAASTSARGKRVCILVHRIELLRQTSSALLKSNVNHGLINANFTPNLTALVQVASVQTLAQRLHKMPYEFDLIIVDEAHHATAGTWKKIINRFPKARVLGVTATPIRGDGNCLGVSGGGLFDQLIMGPQIQELIDLGYLVKPIVYGCKEKIDLTGVRTKMGDYDKEEIARRVDKPMITGSAVKHYTQLCPGTPAVVFCVSIKHAQHVAEEFRNAGYRAYSVDGTMEDAQRKRILNGLGNGSVQIVTSCDIISEGTDIPAIGCAILLRPTQSLGLYLQQVGRALRPCDGKEHAIILDHVGNVINHGMPEEPREWSLDGTNFKRKKKKGDDEPLVKVKQCESCYATHPPAPKCPQCGFVYEVVGKKLEEVDGTLTQITANDLKRKRQIEEAKAQTLEELEALAASRGYKKNWAMYRFNARLNKNNDGKIFI